MKGPLQSALRRLTQATRPLALRSAGRAGSSTAIICHVGRRSGQAYKTPIVAIAHDDDFLIALPYGDRTDWLKNVLAKGSATLITGGQTYEVNKPQIVPMSEATGYFQPKEQRLHKRFRVESALRLHRETPHPAEEH